MIQTVTIESHKNCNIALYYATALITGIIVSCDTLRHYPVTAMLPLFMHIYILTN